MSKEARITKAYRESVTTANAESLKVNVPYFTAKEGRIYATYADGRKAVVGTTPPRNSGDVKTVAKSRSSRRT